MNNYFLLGSIIVIFFISSSTVFAEEFSSKIPAGVTLYQVNSIARDSTGNIYATLQKEVVKFDSNGTVLLRFGSLGSGNGQFNYPEEIALDSLGNIYVVDTGNNRIQKFNSQGIFQLKFGANDGDGTSGSNNGEFVNPKGIALDSLGNIYVVDTGNNRIQKFDSSGIYQSQFGSSGSGDGQFNSPQKIKFDSSNNIYVVDTGNSRVQKFNSVGTFQGWLGECTGGINCIGNQRSNGFSCSATTCTGLAIGSGDGQFDTPEGIAIDISNNVYVGDCSNNNIQKFNSAGTFQWNISMDGVVDGSINCPYSISSDSSNNIYVSEPFNHKIQKFNTNGTFLLRYGSFGSENSQFWNPHGIITDSALNVYVVDTTNNRIQKFNSAGTFQGWLGKCTGGISCDVGNQRSNGFSCSATTCTGLAAGSSDGQFSHPNDIAVDTSNNVYVVDTNNSRIQKFNSAGIFLDKFGSNGNSDGQFNGPTGITTDSVGNIYVIDTGGHSSLQKFNSTKDFQWTLGGSGSGDGQFSSPQTLITDSSNNIYVVDTNNHRIQKFNSTGTFQGWLGKCTGGTNCDVGNQRSNGFSCSATTCTGLGSGSFGGQFNLPTGITLDPSNNFLVTDNGNHRIQKFSITGTFRSEFGSLGSDDGQFSESIWGITSDRLNSIYVVDNFESNIKKFGPTPCTVPGSGDMIIISDCTLLESKITPENVIIQNNSIMTIPNGVSLNIDFTTKHLMVKSGSSILIKSGGSIH